MITFTADAALLGGVVFIGSGLAGFGVLKITVLDGMLKVLTALEAEVKFLKADNKKLHAEMSRMKQEGELKSRQLTVSLRVIEYFERVITVVIKGRPRMPKDLSSAIDTGLKELAEFRQQATLDLESMTVNREHYDWLLAREALMGPDRDMGPDRTEIATSDTAPPNSTTTLPDTEGKKI